MQISVRKEIRCKPMMTVKNKGCINPLKMRFKKNLIEIG